MERSANELAKSLRLKSKDLFFDDATYAFVGACIDLLTEKPNEREERLMKYRTFDNISEIPWQVIHCTSKFPQDIMRALMKEQFVSKFTKSEHLSNGCPKIINDENLYIMQDSRTGYNLWEFGGPMRDIDDITIPNVYRIRKIGMLYS